MVGFALKASGLSRRAAVATVSVAFVSAGILPVCAQARSKAASRSQTRVVVVDASDGPDVASLDVPSVLRWAVSEVEAVNLIAVNCYASVVGSSDIAFAESLARHHICHVALVGDEAVVIGPAGRLVPQVTDSHLPVYRTRVGVITIGLEASLDIAPVTEIFMQTGVDRGRRLPTTLVSNAAPNRFYTLDLSVSRDEHRSGPAILGPDGGVMTHAAAGRAQGVTALLDIAGLRKSRDNRAGYSV